VQILVPKIPYKGVSNKGEPSVFKVCIGWAVVSGTGDDPIISLKNYLRRGVRFVLKVIF
jgi:hypothetical protein